jgi:2-polyprenyl-3-methyl-5-hydroxy-6-metoxy-1,4-benzoquinol methylase
MANKDRLKWDTKYKESVKNDLTPCDVLKDNSHLLPNSGTALDYAAGFGANAIFLAKRNLTSHAWDISSVALNKLKQVASELDLSVITEVRDVELNPPKAETFDVIVVSFFLHRPTFTKLIEALRPGGLLFYQTFTQEKVSQLGPTNPDYLLKKNELLCLSSGLETVVYREEGVCGNVSEGLRNQAMIVARKPA